MYENKEHKDRMEEFALLEHSELKAFFSEVEDAVKGASDMGDVLLFEARVLRRMLDSTVSSVVPITHATFDFIRLSNEKEREALPHIIDKYGTSSAETGHAYLMVACGLMNYSDELTEDDTKAETYLVKARDIGIKNGDNDLEIKASMKLIDIEYDKQNYAKAVALCTNIQPRVLKEYGEESFKNCWIEHMLAMAYEDMRDIDNAELHQGLFERADALYDKKMLKMQEEQRIAEQYIFS